MVDNLISRTFAWEDEKNTPFMYDGVSVPKIYFDLKVYFCYLICTICEKLIETS
jgi:hypothetical protein